MDSNPPINVNGTIPVVSVNAGDYVFNDKIYVFLESIFFNPSVRPGTSVTIRNTSIPGLNPGNRQIYISTFVPNNDFVLKFSDGSDTVLLGSNSGDSFTTTVLNSNTWLKQVTVLQGQNKTQNEDIIAYNSRVSSMTASSISTMGDLFVRGTSYFRGPLIGLINPTFVTGVSTLLFSTGILNTSSLVILQGLQTSNIGASSITVFSTIANDRLSSITYFSRSTFTSSLNLIDTRNLTQQVKLVPSNDTMSFIEPSGRTYVLQTLEQSGFSNISTQMAPTLVVADAVAPVSSLARIVTTSLANSRFDTGLSSFSTQTRSLLFSLSQNDGLVNLGNTFRTGISTFHYVQGLSTLSTTTFIGLSTVAAVPGASNLSTLIPFVLSSANVQPGLSSVSSFIAPGVSSITAFVPISSLSTSIALSMSTVAAKPGVDAIYSTITAGISTLATNTGLYNLSSIYSFGVSSVAAGPGISSLSSVLFSTASTFKSGSVISSFSTITSFGISSLAAVTGYSSLVETLVPGLSSIVDYGYQAYSNDLGVVTSTNRTGLGVSSLLQTIRVSLSTISDGPGISSISSFFPLSLSGITVAVGLSTLSTVVSRGVSSIVIPVPFPSSYSTASTFTSSLFLRDLSSGQELLVSLRGEDLFMSSIQYPPRLEFLNSSTISTQTMEVSGGFTLSSLVVSSMSLTSSFTTFTLDSKTVRTQSTSISSLIMSGYVNEYPHEIVASNGGLFIGKEDGYLQVNLPGAAGISSLSTLFGFSYLDLVQNVPISTVSTAVAPTVSTINFIPGLNNVERYGNSNIPQNHVAISTLQVLTSTATFFNLTGIQYSTTYVSTQVVSTQFLYTSTLIAFTGQVSTFAPALSTTNQVLGLNINTSSLSTGILFLSSTGTFVPGGNYISTVFQTSSMNIHNSNTYFSTVSTGRLFVSTLRFAPISTLFASSGLLYLETNTNVGTAGAPRNFVQFGLAGSVNLFGQARGISTASIAVSSIFTSSVIVSTGASSFTLDTNAIISSGIFSTNIQQFVVKRQASTFFGVNPQGWDVGGTSLAYGITAANDCNQTLAFGPSFQRGYFSNMFNNQANAAFGLTSTFLGSTISLEWDGHMLLAGGVDYFNTTSNMVLLIPPGNYQTSNSRYLNLTGSNPDLMWIRRYPQFADTPFTRCRAISFNGNQYIAVGNADTQLGTIKYSCNGITWSNCTQGGWASDGTANGDVGGFCIQWDGHKWLAGGSNNSATGSPLQFSYNGIQWFSTGVSLAGSVGRIDKMSYFNDKVYNIGGFGFSGNCNIKYSYDGLSWSNANLYVLTTFPNTFTMPYTFTNNPRCLSLLATNYHIYMYYNNIGISGNFPTNYDLPNSCGSISVDGINFYYMTQASYQGTGSVSAIYDGNIIAYSAKSAADNSSRIVTMSALVSNANTGNREEGNGYNQNFYRTPFTSGNFSITSPLVTRSNVIPSLKMSNLSIYGSAYHSIYLSTNFIQGWANNPVFRPRSNGTDLGYGNTKHMELQNYLNFNNTLKIWGLMSTVVQIDTPGNPNSIINRNRHNHPRATLDVLCTINVAQASMFPRMYQVPPSGYPSTLGPADRIYDFYVTGSTFMTNVAVGRSGDSDPYWTNFTSTPQTFFDIYNGVPSTYTTFRGQIANDTTATTILNRTNLTNTSVTCYPMASNSGSALVYYWRNGTTNYKLADTGFTYFTGQHPTNCIDVSPSTIEDYIGQIVSVVDQGYTIYDISGNKVTGSNAIQITNTSPITKLTTADKDPNVFGVITNAFNNGLQGDGIIDDYTKTPFTTNLFDRIMVNSIGEGAIWVTNYGGNVSNGDYLCSSPIPGLARKQDDGRLRNYTVAKATMTCDFNPPYVSTVSSFIWEGSTLSSFVSCLAYKCEPITFQGSNYMKAFIGCTYHCG